MNLLSHHHKIGPSAFERYLFPCFYLLTFSKKQMAGKGDRQHPAGF